jgi:hypothetical protein
VRFDVGAATCSTATSATGAASCALPEDALALGPSDVAVRFDGDALYSTSADTGPVLVYALPVGGAFAVGDRSTTGRVTFWSRSWWLANTLSGGPAPAAFKGFATATSFEPGGDWRAAPGFDQGPADVPEWMGAVVTTTVTKSGPTISGDVAGLVVVHVDTYVPTLAGRGTVVATIR